MCDWRPTRGAGCCFSAGCHSSTPFTCQHSRGDFSLWMPLTYFPQHIPAASPGSQQRTRGPIQSPQLQETTLGLCFGLFFSAVSLLHWWAGAFLLQVYLWLVADGPGTAQHCPALSWRMSHQLQAHSCQCNVVLLTLPTVIPTSPLSPTWLSSPWGRTSSCCMWVQCLACSSMDPCTVSCPDSAGSGEVMLALALLSLPYWSSSGEEGLVVLPLWKGPLRVFFCRSINSSQILLLVPVPLIKSVYVKCRISLQSNGERGT